MSELKKPTTLSETFGSPPVSIQAMVSMKVQDSQITIYHSDLLARSDVAFKNYIKSAREVVNVKFHGFTLEVKPMADSDFQEFNTSERTEEISENSKIQSDVLNLIERCAQARVSDIHIDTRAEQSIIRVRINGELATWQKHPKEYSNKIISVIYNTMCDVAEAMHTGTEFQDAVFARRAISEKLSGVRVTCGPSMNGPFMVLRLLYTENIELIEGVNPLRQLGYTEKQVDDLESLIVQPSGIILVSGPTGSGKSTTLKYIIKRIAEDNGLNVVSVEDPPEYNILGVRQIPVSVKSTNEDREAAFGKSIRSTLRSDPDRIMIGEIRDAASAIMAITCAQTGHQVWTTVHANGTFSILDRMLALMIGPKYSERQAISVLSDATIINGLMFQRLAPILCDDCKIPLKANGAIDKLSKMQLNSLINGFRREHIIENQFGVLEDETRKNIMDYLFEHVYLVNNSVDSSCKNPRCNSGVVDRTVISELVYTDAALLESVFSTSSTAAKRIWNSKNQTHTLQANARSLISKGKLDPRSAIANIGPIDADVKEMSLIG